MKAKGLLSKMLMFAVVVLLVLVPVFACAPAPPPAPPPTPAAPKPTIRHYMTVDLTGVYAILVPDLFEGQVDYYRYVNEHGGINGHPVELIWGETGNVMSRAWSHYKRFKEAGAQLLWIASSPEGEAFKATLGKDKIFCPLNYGQSDPQLYPPGWVYIDGCSYGEGFGTFLKWVKDWWDKLPAAEKERRKAIDPAWTKPRVGIIGPDVAYGKAAHIAMTKDAPGYAASIGVEYMGQAFPAVVPVDVTPQIMQLVKDVRQPRIDWIWTQGLSQIVTVWLKNMEAMGLARRDPTSGEKVGMAGFWWATAAEMLRRVDPRLVEGYICSTYNYWPQVEVEHPGIKKCVEMRQQYRGKAPCEYYVRGVRAAQIVMELTRITLEKYGYEGLTGENYEACMELIPQGFKGPWELGPGVYIKPNDRRTATQMLFYSVRGGKLVRMSDWLDVPHLFPATYKNLFPGEPVYE